MAKKRNKSRRSRKNLARNAEWLEHRLGDIVFDLDALQSMPLDEVKSELKRIAPDAPDLTPAINERLPEGVSIASTGGGRKRRRTKKVAKKDDRPAAAPSATGARFRWFSLRGVVALTVLVALSAWLIPQAIRTFREQPPDPAAAVQGEPPAPVRPPTWIEGPADGELVRGVRYRIEGLEQIAVHTPLPANPDSLTATVRLRVTVDPQGHVINLISLEPVPAPIEAAVIDSVLNWRFSPSADTAIADRTGRITVSFYPP